MYALPVLNSFASQIAGTPTSIQCDAASTFDPGTLGQVYWQPDGKTFIPVIHLPVATCNRLEHSDTGNAIEPADMLTLMHEAEHVALESGDECLVETTALANEWSLVRLFKLAAWRTKAILAGASYVDAQLLPAYRSCR